MRIVLLFFIDYLTNCMYNIQEQVRAECGCHQFSMKGGGIMMEYIVKFLFLSIYANIMLLIISFALIIYLVIKFK